MRALIRRIVDHILGCRPKQVARRRDLYEWSGFINNPEFPDDWEPPSAALRVPEPWERTEVIDFEPSDEFVMPEAMGIDYVPEQDDNPRVMDCGHPYPESDSGLEDWELELLHKCRDNDNNSTNDKEN